MNVTLERIIPIAEAFERLRKAPLDAAGDEKILVYEHADMRLADFYPDDLNPTSLYVLRKNLEVQRCLRQIVLERYGIDTLDLTAVLCLKTSEGIIGLAPPVAEIYEERVQILPKEGDREPLPTQNLRVLMLKDGMHRAWLAREEGRHIRCVLIRGARHDCAPYIYPNEWSQVCLVDAVPPLKKYYRRQNIYSFMRPLRALRQVDDTSVPVQWGR